jgi:signal peptidase I
MDRAMTTRLALRVGRLGGLLALLLTAVWLFWPTALGGATTYVTTHGVSMQPRFHNGDMAVLHSADTYAVGDIVAFHSVELNTTVMHRIIAREGDRFVTQGDNNSWIDPDRPSAGEVLGRLWFRIPEGGDVVAVFRTPAFLMLAALAGATVLWRLRTARGRRRPDEPRGRMPTVSMPARARARQVAVASGAVALLCAGGGVALFLLPVTDVEEQIMQVTQRGTYAYSGTAVPGVTYPTGVIVTGDPVYTELLRTLTVQFALDVTAPGLDSLRGTARLDVSLAAPDGWTATLDSGPPGSVEAGILSASVALDLARAADLLERHYEEIGTKGGVAAMIITPVVEFAGTLHGEPFAATAPPPLRLDLDAAALRLAGNPAEALASSTVTDVTVDQVTDHHVTVLGVSLPVSFARTVVLSVLVVAALGAAGAVWLGWPRSGNAVDEFLMRHAGRIVEVNSFTLGATVIDVTDPDALHLVAERLDGLVLHHIGPYGHLFAVQDADTTYCHMVSQPAPSDSLFSPSS